MPSPPVGLSVFPVAGLPEFAPGDDLAAAVAEAAPWLADGDVVVVTSKVVSKVEGRLVHVPPGADRERMRLQAVEPEQGQTDAVAVAVAVVVEEGDSVRVASGTVVNAVSVRVVVVVMSMASVV